MVHLCFTKHNKNLNIYIFYNLSLNLCLNLYFQIHSLKKNVLPFNRFSNTLDFRRSFNETYIRNNKIFFDVLKNYALFLQEKKIHLKPSKIEIRYKIESYT